MFRDLVMSYGVEPSFGLYYWKRTRISGKYEYYFCVPQVVIDKFKEVNLDIPIEANTVKDSFDGKIGQKVAKYIDENLDRVNIYQNHTSNIDYKSKLEMMSYMMKNIDSSISVTYELKEDAKWKDVYNFILLAYDQGIKSVTAFPKQRLYGIVSNISFRQLAENLIADNISIHKQNFSDEEYQSLYGVSLSHDQISITSVPKRPKILKCDVHHTSIQGQKYFVLVGLLNNTQPYEVFAGKNGFLPSKITSGKIIRKRHGYYIAEFDDSDITLSPVTASCGGEHEDTITRLTSMSLRHGAKMQYIVQQLEQVGANTGLNSFVRGLVRTLKKYISDGTKEKGITCPECQSTEIVRMDGCQSCSCGWSRCV